MKHLALAGISLSMLAIACGAEAPLGEEEAASERDRSEASSDNGSQRASSDVELDAEDGTTGELPEGFAEALEREEQAPGFDAPAYPEPPYGFTQGSVVPNLRFVGWASPREAGFDSEQATTVALADFYDPDGEKGTELLMVNAVAIWCGVCQQEYAELRSEGIHERFGDRGLSMLGVLFEDADAAPARYSDLETWSRVFDVDFPFVLDPGFKMGAFFDRSATPMNMVIDTRTMKIMRAMTGYDPGIFLLIEQELEDRGR